MPSDYGFVENLGTLEPPITSGRLDELRTSLPPEWSDCAVELEQVPGDQFRVSLVRKGPEMIAPAKTFDSQCPDLPYLQARGYYRSRRGHEPTILVLHITAGWGNEVGLGQYFQKPKGRDGKIRQTSAHMGIGRFGGAMIYVPKTGGAWHAGGRPGVSVDWDGREQVNLRSYGIELCNRGWVKDKIAKKRRYQKRAVAGFATVKHQKSRKLRSWERFPRAQLETLVSLLPWVVAEMPTIKFVTGHEDLVRGKLDPGPLFPWELIDWEGNGLIRMERDWKTGKWYEHRGGKRRLYRGNGEVA